MSLRGFTVLLLGLYFAEQAVEEKGLDESEFPAAFLRFEQLAAYSRLAGHKQLHARQSDILGITRVRRRLAEGKGRVVIGTGIDGQILSNQKTYGLWGLYTVAARESGWVQDGGSQLTILAHEFVTHTYLPQLEAHRSELLRWLASDQRRHFDPTGKLGRALAKQLGPKLKQAERNFYAEHLLARTPESSQQRLWQHLQKVNRNGGYGPNDQFSMPELREILKRVRTGRDAELLVALNDILHVERVLAIAGNLFGFMLGRDGQRLEVVADEVRAAWGKPLQHLDTDAFQDALLRLPEAADENGELLSSAARALATGDYIGAAGVLIQLNAAVMQARGGNSWVRIKSGRLDVRYREAGTTLPSADELPDLWTNSYFINSLKRIGYQIEPEVHHGG